MYRKFIGITVKLMHTAHLPTTIHWRSYTRDDLQQELDQQHGMSTQLRNHPRSTLKHRRQKDQSALIHDRASHRLLSLFESGPKNQAASSTVKLKVLTQGMKSGNRKHFKRATRDSQSATTRADDNKNTCHSNQANTTKDSHIHT